MGYSLLTSKEVAGTLADRLRQLRLLKKWKRSTLSERSGVSVSSLIRFEQTGQISLENFLKLLFALDRQGELEHMLLPPEAGSIDELEKQDKKASKRGSI